MPVVWRAGSTHTHTRPAGDYLQCAQLVGEQSGKKTGEFSLFLPANSFCSISRWMGALSRQRRGRAARKWALGCRKGRLGGGVLISIFSQVSKFDAKHTGPRAVPWRDERREERSGARGQANKGASPRGANKGGGSLVAAGCWLLAVGGLCAGRILRSAAFRPGQKKTIGRTNSKQKVPKRSHWPQSLAQVFARRDKKANNELGLRRGGKK